MTKRGVRLFPMGLVLAAAAMAGAQEKPAAVNAATPEMNAAAPAAAHVYPKRPAEEAPRMPKVTCRGDQITIAADNSTLEQILAMVKGCTGAKIDIPEGASKLRSFEQFGPGPTRAVLDDLLSGTPYNYVIESSEASPQKVEMVLLTMRDTDEKGTTPADLPQTNGRKLWQHMQKFDKPDPSMVNEDGTLIDPDHADAASDSHVGLPKTADASTDGAAASGTPAADASAAVALEPPPVTPVAQPVMSPSSGGDASQAVQGRIAQMQQLFNQRQQMIKQQGQNPGGTPNN